LKGEDGKRKINKLKTYCKTATRESFYQKEFKMIVKK
jgi:hypothetical protein